MAATLTTEDVLIAAHVRPHPWRKSASWAVVGERSVPIWAVMSRYDLAYDDAETIAREYGMSVDAVHAAVAYYHRHRNGIDAIIASNRGE